jgi:hypothetical protein
MMELPQRLRMDFDRGRVTLAGSVEQRSTRQRAIVDFMVAVQNALRESLVEGSSVEEAVAPAAAMQERIIRSDHRRRVIARVAVLALIAVVILLVTVASRL